MIILELPCHRQAPAQADSGTFEGLARSLDDWLVQPFVVLIDAEADYLSEETERSGVPTRKRRHPPNRLGYILPARHCALFCHPQQKPEYQVTEEVKDLRRKARDLKECVADLTLENRLLKKA